MWRNKEIELLANLYRVGFACDKAPVIHRKRKRITQHFELRAVKMKAV